LLLIDQLCKQVTKEFLMWIYQIIFNRNTFKGETGSF
jgi:hypothetical protein